MLRDYGISCVVSHICGLNEPDTSIMPTQLAALSELYFNCLGIGDKSKTYSSLLLCYASRQLCFVIVVFRGYLLYLAA